MKLSSFNNTTDIYDQITDKNCGNVENKENLFKESLFV